jgi:hypothetical protein
MNEWIRMPTVSMISMFCLLSSKFGTLLNSMLWRLPSTRLPMIEREGWRRVFHVSLEASSGVLNRDGDGQETRTNAKSEGVTV